MFKGNSLIAVVGPTAVGKTRLAIELAKKFDGEIVSADSMQVYKYMDIGTAKPDKIEMQDIPHHMIDVIDPRENFNVYEYVDMAREAVNDIIQRGKLPILTGGTGLYIDSFLQNVEFSPFEKDMEYRACLEKLALEHGNKYLHDMLIKCDPESAERLHENDKRRIIRALEVFHISGEPMTELNKKSKKSPSLYKYVILGLTCDRLKLYDIIDKRVDLMLDTGLVQEVEQLLKLGCNEDSTAMKGLGYKEVIAYLKGETEYGAMVEILKRDTRRYAKRQLTWFRRNKEINWIHVNHGDGETGFTFPEITEHAINLIIKYL